MNKPETDPFWGQDFPKIGKVIDDFVKQEAELRHKILVKACEENDFIVPDEKTREVLKKILPENASITVSKFTDYILMVKKFDPSELLWLDIKSNDYEPSFRRAVIANTQDIQPNTVVEIQKESPNE